jgi:hypothetical protein
LNLKVVVFDRLNSKKSKLPPWFGLISHPLQAISTLLTHTLSSSSLSDVIADQITMALLCPMEEEMGMLPTEAAYSSSAP